MDTVPLVDELKDDGQLLLDRLAEDGVEVRVACWLKRANRDRWSLYVATPLIDTRGAIAAYGVVFTSYQALGELFVRDDDITLVGGHHPLVEDLQNKYLVQSLHVLDGSGPVMLGGMAVEGVYVYPRRNQVTVHSLEFHGDPLRVRSLAFEPQNAGAWLTVGDDRYPAETGVGALVAVPDGSTLVRDGEGTLVLDWPFRGRRKRSQAADVVSLARIGLHGFRLLPKLLPAGAAPAG